MPTLYIPKLRDKLVLVNDWSFPVCLEHRNESVIKRMGYGYGTVKREVWMKKLPGQWHYGRVNLPEDFTIPAGTELTVDRIYIRNGQAGFDSVTFRCKLPKLKGKGEDSLRFWVKLEEANGLEFDHPAAPVPAAVP
jgi:hypothetical protein